MIINILIFLLVSVIAIKLSFWLPILNAEIRLDRELMKSDVKNLHVRVEFRKTEQGRHQLVFIAFCAEFKKQVLSYSYIKHVILLKNVRHADIRNILKICEAQCKVHNDVLVNKFTKELV